MLEPDLEERVLTRTGIRTSEQMVLLHRRNASGWSPAGSLSSNRRGAVLWRLLGIFLTPLCLAKAILHSIQIGSRGSETPLAGIKEDR
jgi:hypothetical protein